jgi:hypothetical protein
VTPGLNCTKCSNMRGSLQPRFAEYILTSGRCASSCAFASPDGSCHPYPGVQQASGFFYV